MSLLFGLIILAALAVQIWTRWPQACAREMERALAMFARAKERFNDAVFRRRMAYKRLFLDPKGDLNQDARVVIAHLAKLARATGSKGIAASGPFGAHVDTNATMIAVGRNELLMAIMKELRLGVDRVFDAVQDEDPLAA